MKYYALFFLMALVPFWLTAQNSQEWQAVQQPIQQLFDGMRAGDSSAVRNAFLPDAGLYTAVRGKDGQPVLSKGSLDRFVDYVGQVEAGAMDEQIWSYDIRVDGLLATAWTTYTFFRNGTLSHCGTNAFELFKTGAGWKISHITDTRNTDGCLTEAPNDPALIDTLLNAWHKAAATADAEGFFSKMTPDGIYLGTDAAERWLRDELRAWSEKAFDREVAWLFRPYDREVYFSRDGQTAWFEEMLDTPHMGICRGSGVLSKTAEGWQIRHYDLALMVPNEKMEAVQQALGK
ncbi:MAG: nuclear transport factor 2 family protein [Phaeodactylibacter sp.]|uniref:nuclear transport factor 2 family protein n=1 Tax=Phaeodactylibacter sp. TaxID=1940289 RepID=UPI0032F065CC